MKNFLLRNKSNIKNLAIFYSASCVIGYVYYYLYSLMNVYLENSVFMPIGFVALTGVVIVYVLLKLIFPECRFVLQEEVPFGLRIAGLIAISGVSGFFAFVPYFALGKGLYYSGLSGVFITFLPPALMIHMYAYFFLMYKNEKEKFKYHIKWFLTRLLFTDKNEIPIENK